MAKIRDLGVLTVYCAFIFFLSAQSDVPLDKLFLYQDKVIHLLCYALMGLLAWRAFGHFIHQRPVLAIRSIGFSSLYGISDEFHQWYVPGRSADLYDLLADIAGATIAVSLILLFRPAATVR